MNLKYRKLLSPVKIGNHVIKNRMVYPNASPHTLQGPETFPADGFRKFYSDLAKNGAAIVTVAEWANPFQRMGPIDLDATHMQSFDMKDPSVHNYFSLMAEEIHFYGSKLLVCAEVDWPEGYSLNGGRKPGPPIPGKGFVEDEQIPVDKIEEVVQQFVQKMKMYKALGYDGMDMRCDLQILPSEKSRSDEYGGELIENRSRFIRRVYEAVKEQIPNFITEATIAWEQPYGYGPMSFGGVNSDQVMEFCKLIDKDVDIFQIREHDGCRSHPTGFNFKSGEHPAVDFAYRMKQEGITALLEPIGGFQEPDEMEKYLSEGKCDLFAMARAFMADPDYIIKIRENRAEEITPCLKCNKCHGVKLEKTVPWITMCSVNPRHGLEHEMSKLVTADTKVKKVAVIGGGATGMRSAIIAAERGHKVTLFEKTNILGGQLLHANYFDFKWPVKNYLEWLIRELDRDNIEVKMLSCPTNEELEDFDVILAATGAIPDIPTQIPGVYDANNKSKYKHVDEVWGKENQLGNHVLIIGGSETGMETAIYLLRAGHKVTMLTRQKKVAHDASGLHYITSTFVKVFPDGRSKEAAEWEKYDDFNAFTEVKIKNLDGNKVAFTDKDGKENVIDADDILICGGHKELMDEALSYADGSKEFYAIGACTGAGNLQECNRQAFARASII